MEAFPRLAIVHSQRGVVTFLEPELSSAGFVVRTAEDAAAGYDLVREWQPAVIVVDLKLPRIDGLAFVKLLRLHTTAPILMMGVEITPEEKVASLASGADYVVSLPTALPEIISLLQSALRRPSISNSDLLAFGDVVLNLRTHETRRGDRALRLTRLEFRLLAALMSEPGRVFTHDELLDEVWGSAAAGVSVLHTALAGLRKKVEAHDEAPLLHTIRGVGLTLRKT